MRKTIVPDMSYDQRRRKGGYGSDSKQSFGYSVLIVYSMAFSFGLGKNHFITLFTWTSKIIPLSCLSFLGIFWENFSFLWGLFLSYFKFIFNIIKYFIIIKGIYNVHKIYCFQYFRLQILQPRTFLRIYSSEHSQGGVLEHTSRSRIAGL